MLCQLQGNILHFHPNFLQKHQDNHYLTHLSQIQIHCDLQSEARLEQLIAIATTPSASLLKVINIFKKSNILNYKLQEKIRTIHSTYCKVVSITLPNSALCMSPKSKMFMFSFPGLILK